MINDLDLFKKPRSVAKYEWINVDTEQIHKVVAEGFAKSVVS